MKTAYLIIGGTEAGKSTTIKGLTGANPRRPYNGFEIQDNKGNVIKLYIKISALQELLADLIDPDELIKRLTEYNYCLLAIRVLGVNGCPDAEVYVKRLIKEDWHVKIVYFDYEVPMPQYFQKFQLNKERINIHYGNDETYPKANVITATVRNFFDWV